MAISSRELIESVLLGPTNDRRQLQESPILGDVWIAFAASPAAEASQERPRSGRPLPAGRLVPGEERAPAFFTAHPDLASKIRVVAEGKPHVIDLLDEVGF